MKAKDGLSTIQPEPHVKLLWRLALYTVLPFFPFFLAAQTTSISGIVNSYYQVIEILPSNDGVRVSNPTGLSQHDKIMIIQMKGASVTTTNNASFGDTMALNNVGNYEIATICSVQGDTAYLFFNLLNQYTVSAKVQLVKFAEYSSALVTDTIKARPWNNTSGTGGVIAISVTNDLTLNAPIYADSSGYRGGGFKLSNGTCGNGFPVPVATAYYYDASVLNPQNGGYKGEGVYDIPIAQSGGRGAPANGGGGGNNHNNGAAGGANLSSGGKGGGNSSSAGCMSNLHGEAGKALSNWGGSKIFFGGGGGAGHANDGFVPSLGGGHGGGIIFIQANDLISNSTIISANGQQGGPALSDGASGGGAGGTIIMNILNSYSGPLTIQANGGLGGTEDDGGNINRCYGAGGGGSGGVIYFTGAVPAAIISVAAGGAGSELARNVGCSAAVPATAGTVGSYSPFYTYARSFDPTGSCHSVLPVQLIYFTARAIQEKISLHWNLLNPEQAVHAIIQKFDPVNGWLNKSSVDIKDSISEYQFTDETPGKGINQYRLKIVGKNNDFFYSNIRQVYLESPNDAFEIYPNPASRRVTITGNITPGAILSITDLSGRIIVQKDWPMGSARIEWNLPEMAQGVYFLRINNTIKKLVIR